MTKNYRLHTPRRGGLGLLLWLAGLLLTNPVGAQAPAFTQAIRFGDGAVGGRCQGAKTVVDAQGNTYVAGSFTSAASFGSTRLASAAYGSTHGFVAKLDAAGNWLWAVRIGQGSVGYGAADQATDIALDNSGAVYVTGYLREAGAQFGSTTLATAGAFVAKLDAAGTWQWAAGGGTPRCIANSLAVRPDGSAVVLTGYFSNNVTFGTLPALASAGGNDAFVARLDGAGIWQWAVRAGGATDDSGTAVALDAAGNAYVTGAFGSGTAAFGPTTLAQTPNSTTSQGTPTDAFVAKLSAGGSWQWAVAAGGTAADGGRGLALSSTGDVVVAGSFASASIGFGPTTLSNGNDATTVGAESVFVARLSAGGSWLAAAKAGGTRAGMASANTSTNVNDLALDAADNAYVTGSYALFGQYGTGSTVFGATSLPAVGAGGAQVFVARLSPAGAWDWAINSGGSGSAVALGIAAGPGSTLSMTGYFLGDQATFGPFTRTLTGTQDAVVVKINSGTGAVLQAAGSVGFGEAEASAVATDAAGNTYLFGNFQRGIGLGSLRLRSVGERDLVVAKRAPNGQYLWAVRAGGAGDERSRGIAVDGSGNVYITGEYYSPTASFGSTTLSTSSVPGNFSEANVFVAKLDAQGDWLWAKQAGGSGYNSNDFSSAVAVDGSGNAYVTGAFRGATASFGSISLSNSTPGTPGTNLFVAKLNPSGSWLWAITGGSVGAASDNSAAIAVDGSGNAYVTGAFSGATAVFGSSTLTSASAPGTGARDAFVARLSPAGSWQWAGRCGGSLGDAGTGVAIDGSGNVYVTGIFNVYAGGPSVSQATADFGPFGFTSSEARVFAAKIAPAGSWVWAVQGGGPNLNDRGGRIAVDGSNNAYLLVGISSNNAVYGSVQLPANSDGRLAILKIDPTGSFEWGVVGSNNNIDGNGIVNGGGLAVSSSGIIYLAGTFYNAPATFGPFTLTGTNENGYTGYFAQLGGTVATRTTPARAARAVALWPNPTRTSVQATGFAPGQPVQVLDALGQVVLRATVPAHGPLQLHLPATLRAGIYLVQAPGQLARLQIE